MPESENSAPVPAMTAVSWAWLERAAFFVVAAAFLWLTALPLGEYLRSSDGWIDRNPASLFPIPLAAGVWSLYGACVCGVVGLGLAAVGAYWHRAQIRVELQKAWRLIGLLPTARAGIAEVVADPKLAPRKPTGGLYRDGLVLVAVAAAFLVVCIVSGVLYAAYQERESREGEGLSPFFAVCVTSFLAAMVTGSWALLLFARLGWSWRKALVVLSVKFWRSGAVPAAKTIKSRIRLCFSRWRLLGHLFVALVLTALHHQALMAEGSYQWQKLKRMWTAAGTMYHVGDDLLGEGQIFSSGPQGTAAVFVLQHEGLASEVADPYLRLTHLYWLEEETARTESAGWTRERIRKEFEACRAGREKLKNVAIATPDSFTKALSALGVAYTLKTSTDGTDVELLCGTKKKLVCFPTYVPVRFYAEGQRIWVGQWYYSVPSLWMLDTAQQQIVIVVADPKPSAVTPSSLQVDLLKELGIFFLVVLVLLSPFLYLRDAPPPAAGK